MKKLLLLAALIISIMLMIDFKQHIPPTQQENTEVIQTVGRDGYTFETKDFTSNNALISFRRYKSVDEVTKTFKMLYPERVVSEGIVILGFTEYRYNDNIDISICTIHIVDPEIQYMPTTLGHELTHCMNGDFHPSVSKKN